MLFFCGQRRKLIKSSQIYSLALSEATLTEEDLVLLFNSLPKRCILLLEDVDTAGLGRAPGEKQAGRQASTELSSLPDKHETKAAISHMKQEDGQNSVTSGSQGHLPSAGAKELPFKSTLTLSGLLNAIDGVASQEGRVLIMVSSRPSS